MPNLHSSPFRLLLVAAAGFLGSCMPEGGPCVAYCDYVCTCHEGEAEYNCEDCRTVYDGADPELMDACQTELTNLENEDEANGTGCSTPEDTAAG